MKTFYIKTLGCKVNQCESEEIRNYMIKLNLKESNDFSNADIIVINTCAVTQKASRQSKQTIHKVICKNSNARLIVTGCYTQTEFKTLAKIQGINLIASNKKKYEIIKKYIFKKINEYISDNSSKIAIKDRGFLNKIHNTDINCKKTRPFVKIQDGCDSFCSYCIIPYARGRSRSLSENRILNEITNLKVLDYKEVVLTGINIGKYGKDLCPKSNIYELLYKITKNKLINRIRISSIEPQELTDNILKLVKNSTKESYICQHLHIPLQSGDDSILKKMHRSYNSEYFIDLVKNILKILPNCSIGFDVLVGFPGESETAFYNTYNLIKNLEVSYLHVFPFSARKQTPAWYYPKKILPEEIKKRSKILRKLGEEKKIIFHKKFLGTIADVLVENKRDRKTGKLRGFSNNYILIKFDGSDLNYNTIQKVKIDNIISSEYVEGHLI